MNWLDLWINTFLKRKKVKADFMTGIKSVAYASLIIGALNFILALVDNADAVNSLLMNLIALPVLTIILMLIFTALFRWVASMSGGKGKFKSDAGAIGVYFGSLVLVLGVFSLVWGLFTQAAFPGVDMSTGAGILSTNMILYYLVGGVSTAVSIYLSIVVLSLWLEDLMTLEKLSLFETAKSIAIVAAILMLLYNLFVGGMLEVLKSQVSGLSQSIA